jgi:hypothetical protein
MMQSRVRVFGKYEYGADTAAGLPSVPTAADKSQALAKRQGPQAMAISRCQSNGRNHDSTSIDKSNDENPAFLRRSGLEVEGLPGA